MELAGPTTSTEARKGELREEANQTPRLRPNGV